MMEGVFDVAIDTPKTHKRAKVRLKSAENRMVAALVLADGTEVVLVGTCEGQEFTVSGSGEFGDVGAVDVSTAKGSVWSNSLSVECETSIGRVEVFGTRLAGSAGDFAGADNYLYSGRWSDAY